MLETTFSVDSFKQNVIYKGSLVNVRQIYNLVVMKPGTDPLNPDKGCDINRFYYYFTDEVDLPTEEKKIKDQIEKYTSNNGVMVKLKINKKGSKHILHVIISDGLDTTMIVSSNGIYSEYDNLDKVSYDLIEEMNKTIELTTE